MLLNNLNSMLKSLLSSGLCLCTLLAFPGIVRSQATQLTTPSSAQMAVNQDFTPLEIQQFVQVLKRWQTLEMEAQKKIVAAINREKLTPQRFLVVADSIQKKGDDPKTNTEVSAEDVERYRKILDRIKEIETEMQPKKEQAVISQGLTIPRFNQIGYTSEQNPALKQKIQQMLGEPVMPPGKAPRP